MPVDDNWCFGCGDHNPIGLHLKFNISEEGVETTFTPQKNHQGFQNMLHGGLMMTLLDEAIAWAVGVKYGNAVTGELSVRIKSFGPIGEPLKLIGRVTSGKKMNMVQGESKILDSNGKIIASAVGKFMVVGQTPRQKQN